MKSKNKSKRSSGYDLRGKANEVSRMKRILDYHRSKNAQNSNAIVPSENLQIINPKKNKTKSLFWIIVLFFSMVFIFIVIYLNFFYYMPCENADCFKEMVSSCRRSTFVSGGSISFYSEIQGLGSGGCKIKLISLDNNFEIPENKEMICKLPLGSEFLPESRIEFCNGELREEIQELIISELYVSVGQNIGKLNEFL